MVEENIDTINPIANDKNILSKQLSPDENFKGIWERFRNEWSRSTNKI